MDTIKPDDHEALCRRGLHQSAVIGVRSMQNVVAVFGTVICVLAVSVFATPQWPDIVIYKGERYYTHSDLMGPFLEKHPKIRLAPPHSGLWRGYLATYEIVNNELLLKKIEDSDEKNVQKEFLSAAGAKGPALKIDWFTGLLSASGGEIMYGGFAPLHSVEIRERHLFLEFRNGVLVKETRMDYLEYLEYLRATYGDRVPEYPQILEKLTHYAATKKGGGSEFIVKLKAEYQREFRESISEFELAAIRVESATETSENKYNRITVSRTLNGARAVYVCYYGEGVVDSAVVEMAMAEWLGFVRSLHKSGIDTLPKRYQKGSFAVEVYSIGKSGKEGSDTFFAPPLSKGQDALKKAVVAMESRIRIDRALEARLSAEYMRIYKVPIPEFERSLKKVRINFDHVHPVLFSAVRTAGGAFVTFTYGSYSKAETRSVELDASEWLSFAKLVSSCSVGEWKEFYYVPGKESEERNSSKWWMASFLFTDRDGVISRGGSVHPPGWSELKKAVDGIEARVRKD